MKLKNKVTVITGGNSGIGFGIATAFQSEGAAGAIAGRKQETLDRCVAALGDNFIGINADVTKMEDLERIFRDTAKKFGKIDSVVVNAGGAVEGVKMGSVADTGEADYDHYMNLNLKSAYFTVQKALPYMKDGGTIVLVGSIAGHRAFPGQSVYAASKAAVISFARGFSLDLLDRNIRVNVVSPGTIDTPAFDKFLPAGQVDHVKNLWAGLIPIGRIGQPADIGKAAVFLASDESSFVVGTEIIADGGGYKYDCTKITAPVLNFSGIAFGCLFRYFAIKQPAMFEILAQYLEKNALLTDSEIAQFRARVITKKLRKKQYLLQEGDVCYYNCFVAKGCMRLYRVGDNGAEHILKFAIEHWWIGDYESYNSGNPAKGNIDALEDSELILIRKEDLDDLVKAIPNFQAFKEKLDARSFDASQNRILSNISDSAEKRYENFIKKYPDFFNRVPLHMIASYLGLTRETLSRIRSNYTKQDK